MSPDSRRRECLACHGTNLVDGRIAKHQRFVPQGRIFSLGYTVKAAVCLDCGLVQNRLDAEQLAEIREKQG
jgi:hypothetical protein